MCKIPADRQNEEQTIRSPFRHGTLPPSSIPSLLLSQTHTLVDEREREKRSPVLLVFHSVRYGFVSFRCPACLPLCTQQETCHCNNSRNLPRP